MNKPLIERSGDRRKLCEIPDVAAFRIKQLERQRDELLAALREAMGWNWLDDDMPADVSGEFESLIARIEAGHD